MKIKTSFFEVETNKNCPCNSYNEFEVKLKSMRTKLHCRYVVCISVGVVIWLITTGTTGDKNFSQWISFASTITSIILSVIAIILSITGESKTDAIRNQMEETSQKLEKTAKSINEANEQNRHNINELKQNIMLLQQKIENLQGNTEKIINQYEKLGITGDVITNNINSEVRWVRKDDK